MAPLTVYDLYTATFDRGLQTLAALLAEAAAHAQTKNLDPDTLAAAALVDDMKPLRFQVQVCSNVAKLTVRRIGGPDPGPWADDETTLAALQARVQKTLALVRTLTAADLAGKDDVLVESPGHGKAVPFGEYLVGFAVPNFFFHLQTVYAILRARGVPLGKQTYLANFAQQP